MLVRRRLPRAPQSRPRVHQGDARHKGHRQEWQRFKSRNSGEHSDSALHSRHHEPGNRSGDDHVPVIGVSQQRAAGGDAGGRCCQCRGSESPRHRNHKGDGDTGHRYEGERPEHDHAARRWPAKDVAPRRSRRQTTTLRRRVVVFRRRSRRRCEQDITGRAKAGELLLAAAEIGMRDRSPEPEGTANLGRLRVDIDAEQARSLRSFLYRPPAHDVTLDPVRQGHIALGRRSAPLPRIHQPASLRVRGGDAGNCGWGLTCVADWIIAIPGSNRRHDAASACDSRTRCRELSSNVR